jgi:hypothetical protein
MDSMKLPDEFSDLQDLADSFAISDDVKRVEHIESASPAELRRLVDSVWPRMGAINAYLDEHDDEPACLLGCLAEATCEVQMDIGGPPDA